MAGITFTIKPERRQAMVDVIYEEITEYGNIIRHRTGERVPAFVWPTPTQDGCFLVEFENGQCQKVQPDLLTFLGSKELFDQYEWRTNEA